MEALAKESGYPLTIKPDYELPSTSLFSGFVFYVICKMNTGQIIRSKSTFRFTAISNEILQSKSLTFEQKGLLAYLLSLPENWVLYKQQLYKVLPDRKTTIDRVFKELQDLGYILSARTIDDKGHFTGWNHIVYDEPTLPEEQDRVQESPSSGIPDIGQTPYIQKTHLIQNTNSIQNSQADIKEKKERLFLDWWNRYGKKVATQDAKKAWSKLSIEEIEICLKVVDEYVRSKPDIKYRPNGATYLNGKRFLDEIIEEKEKSSAQKEKKNPNHLELTESNKQGIENAFKPKKSVLG